MANMDEYYVYKHIRDDNHEVFYIGIAKKLQPYSTHLKEYRRAYHKRTRSQFWKNIINKTSYKVEIIFETNDEKLIYEKEKELIKLYGRRDLGLGTLVNQTDGGESVINLSQAAREKLRKRFLGTKLSKEHREKCRLARLGTKLTQEHKDAIGRVGLNREYTTGKKIYQYDLTGNFIMKYRSINKAHTENNFSESNIRRGLNTNTPANGFMWFYEYKGEKI